MTYAIIRTGGKQFRAEPGKTLRMPSLAGRGGHDVEFNDVLLGSDGDTVRAGVPTLSGAKVTGEIVKHGLGEKIVVFKFKRRKNYARSRGIGRASRKSASRTSPSAEHEEISAMAHKKGVGSSRNGRDATRSTAAIKKYGGEKVIAGNIIVRQCGTKWHPGNNVGLGTDYTIYALVDGVVKFEHKNKTQQKVSVYPASVRSPSCVDAPATV